MRVLRDFLTGAAIMGAAMVPTLAHPLSAVAQSRTTEDAKRTLQFAPLPSLTDREDNRTRLEQLFGRGDAAGHLLRSISSLSESNAESSAVTVFLPRVRTVWNSDIPSSRTDGALWAGAGMNLVVSGGLRVALGPLTLIAAPEVGYSQNRSVDFFVSPHFPAELGPPFHRPWHEGPVTADLPLRLGTRPVTTVHPGQSSLSLSAGGATFGIATENHWWGPGIRNAIVLSNNAPGFPHLFLRPGQPLATQIGNFDGRWIVGGLRTSSQFGSNGDREESAIGGLAMTFSPHIEPGLTLGIARTVYRPIAAGSSRFDVGYQVLTHWAAASAGIEPDESMDQILSLFGRWVLPSAGSEVYVEWARRELPTSIRDLLIHPNHSQAYTLGLQSARPLLGGSLRIQAEVTNLEMSTTFRTGRTTSYYVSYAGGPGYTHDGRVLGASIGPGSSSQWLAVDLIRRSWSLGGFAGRTRWDNDAFYTLSLAQNRSEGIPYLSHDVSVLGGLRGSYEWRGIRANVELTTEYRMNYLFQNWAIGWESAADDAMNVLNRSVRISFTAADLPRTR